MDEPLEPMTIYEAATIVVTADAWKTVDDRKVEVNATEWDAAVKVARAWLNSRTGDPKGYKINNETFDTLLRALADNRIVKIRKTEDGNFRLREACDDYYNVHLTPSQLAALGKELIDLALR